MSFLKITDPAKRDLFVADFLKTKKNIQQNFLSEKLGDIGMQRELVKLYKPIVDSQSATSKEQNALLSTIMENSAATSNALQALPASISSSIKAIQFPQYPSIQAYEDDPVDITTLGLGDIATKYLKEYASKKSKTDTVFGIRSEDGDFFIGNSPISFDGDEMMECNKTYKGTPGLWELMTMKDPDESIFDDDDRKDYDEILISTGALFTTTKAIIIKPRSSRGVKYNKIIKPLLSRLKGKPSTGEGVVIL